MVYFNTSIICLDEIGCYRCHEIIQFLNTLSNGDKGCCTRILTVLKSRFEIILPQSVDLDIEGVLKRTICIYFSVYVYQLRYNGQFLKVQE